MKIVLLAKADFAENKRFYRNFLIIVFLLNFIFSAFISLGDGGDEVLASIYEFAGILGITVCCLLLTATFNTYHQRGRAIFTAMIPVGKCTKFVYLFLKYWLLSPIIVSVIIFINAYIWGYDGDWIFFKQRELLTIGIIGGVAFFSSLLFKRFQLIYTFIILYIAWGIMVFLKIDSTESMTQTIISLVIIVALITATWLKYKYLQIKQ